MSKRIARPGRCARMSPSYCLNGCGRFRRHPSGSARANRDQKIVTLLDYIASGQHAGETWQVTLTELEAEQTLTWYLQRYPQIPFAHPRIIITPDAVSGEGDVTIAGLRVHVGGKACVTR